MGVTVKGIQEQTARLVGIADQAAPYALAAGLTSMAWKVRGDAAGKMAAPKPATVRQIRVDKATKTQPFAKVYVDDAGDWKAAKTLGHLFRGGVASHTRTEGALQHKGILSVGNKTDVLPPKGGPRLTGPQTVRVLSAIQAMGERGYKANMTAKNLKRLAKYGRSDSGYRTIRGTVYFVSYGTAVRIGGRSWQGGRDNRQLAPGIWKKSGTHGSNVEPVLLFGRTPRYRQLINLEALAEARLPEFPAEFYRQLGNMITKRAFGE